MSVVKFSSPNNTLAAALKSARPAMAQQAIDRANANLTRLGSECLVYVDALLEQLREVAAPSDLPTAQRFAAVYQVSLRFIGVASLANLPDLENAARSLCDVVDGLLERGIEDEEPIKVHVESMRLLRHASALGDERNVLIAGLRRVRSRFAVLPGAVQAAT